MPPAATPSSWTSSRTFSTSRARPRNLFWEESLSWCPGWENWPQSMLNTEMNQSSWASYLIPRFYLNWYQKSRFHANSKRTGRRKCDETSVSLLWHCQQWLWWLLRPRSDMRLRRKRRGRGFIQSDKQWTLNSRRCGLRSHGRLRHRCRRGRRQ